MDDEFLDDNVMILDECFARNAFVFVITDCLSKLDKSKMGAFVEVPSLGMFTGVLAILPI